jgi:hypothetical protein
MISKSRSIKLSGSDTADESESWRLWLKANDVDSPRRWPRADEVGRGCCWGFILVGLAEQDLHSWQLVVSSEGLSLLASSVSRLDESPDLLDATPGLVLLGLRSAKRCSVDLRISDSTESVEDCRLGRWRLWLRLRLRLRVCVDCGALFCGDIFCGTLVVSGRPFLRSCRL